MPAIKKKAIKFRQELFWDVDPETIDPKKNARYIIERILDFGSLSEARWLFHFYSRSFIRKTIERPRVALHNKSKALWSLILRQPKRRAPI